VERLLLVWAREKRWVFVEQELMADEAQCESVDTDLADERVAKRVGPVVRAAVRTELVSNVETADRCNITCL
jgi:hypothetical protein